MTKEQEKLVMDNEGLIVKCAHDLHITLDEDARQEGWLALTEAVNHYNPNKNASFCTYAYTCIRWKLLTYINKTNCLVKSKRVGTKFEHVSVALFSDFGIIDMVDNIEDPCNYLDIDIFLDDVNVSLGEVARKVAELLYKGYSKPQIRTELKVDYPTINNCIDKLKSYVKEYFYE